MKNSLLSILLLGLAGLTQANESPEALMSRVDKALYQAKSQGRNKVCTV